MSSSPMSGFAWRVGVRVSVTLKSDTPSATAPEPKPCPPQIVDGEVFCFDETNKSYVVIQQSTGSAQSKTFRFVNASRIESIRLLAGPDGTMHTELGLNTDADLDVDEELIRSRENEVLQHAKALAPPLGKDVSEEAQLIFNALHKTLPVEWRGQDIVVLKECVIAPPYGQVAGGTDGLRRQISKIIQGEKQKLASRA